MDLIRKQGSVFVDVVQPEPNPVDYQSRTDFTEWIRIAQGMALDGMALDTPEPTPEPEPTRLDGLGVYKHRKDAAMLFDDRKKGNGYTPRNRANVIAWINRSKDQENYWLNIGQPRSYQVVNRSQSGSHELDRGDQLSSRAKSYWRA